MSNLSAQIAECIALKKGDKDFALHHMGKKWFACIGNSCPHVMLGESYGEFEIGECETPEQAVWKLLELLKKYDGQLPPGRNTVSA